LKYETRQLRSGSTQPAKNRTFHSGTSYKIGGSAATESADEDFFKRFNHWMIGRYYELAGGFCQELINPPLWFTYSGL